MLAVRVNSSMWRQCVRHIASSCQQKRGETSGEVRDKAALVTGGASGIGLQCCKALLRCGCRGVTIADRDNDSGEAALKELAEEFGNDKAVFVNCDVTKSELVDWAFKTTLNAFNRLDIVINNAGVLNDKVWENEIHTNVCGTMVGSLLGLQYMAAHCAGQGGFVINIGSTMGLSPFGGAPIYSMTQAAILGLSRALGTGNHYERTRVKVMAIAVGLTETPLMINATKNTINTKFSADFKKDLECHKWQKPEVVANTVLAAIKDGEAGALWVIESGSKPYKICVPCYQDMKEPSAKNTIVDCAMPGKMSSPRSHKKEKDEDCEKDLKKEVTEKVVAKATEKKAPVAKEAKPPKKQEPKPKPKPKQEAKPSSKKSTGSVGSCGTCPEAKWHDGPPPKKEKEKEKKVEEEVDDSDNACNVDLKIKKKKKKDKGPKKCKPKVQYLGKCKPPKADDGTGAKGGKPGKADKKGAKAAKPAPKAAKAPPKAAAKPPPKAAKAPPKAAKAPPKAAKPPPKAGKAPPKTAKKAVKKSTSCDKSDSESIKSELSFDCECDKDQQEEKSTRRKRSRSSN